MTDEELAELRNKIADAEAKYHQLQLGNVARVIVDQNGERVEFTVVKRSDLYAYLQSLRAQLPDAPVGTGYAKPIRFLF